MNDDEWDGLGLCCDPEACHEITADECERIDGEWYDNAT